MADALPGAPAPVSAAVRAAHPNTTTPQPAADQALAADANVSAPAGSVVALPPVPLLRQLDAWMHGNGLDDCHPWRLSILTTLARHGADAPTVCCESTGKTFSELAELVDSLECLLSEVLNGRAELWGAALAVVGQVGWMADELSQAHGVPPWRKDAAAWMLSPRMREALKDARQAVRAEGGAA